MHSRELYLLDTNILILLIRGGEKAQRISETYGLKEIQYIPLVSVISKAEILAFALRNNWGQKKLQAIEILLANSIVIDTLSNDIILSYIELDAFLKNKKPAKTIKQNDIWIAATAKATDSILLAADNDFNYFPVTILKHEHIDINTGKTKIN